MTEVNVAELRRALAALSQQWTYPEFGGPAVPTQATTVIVNRSTLAALLDAYERDQEADRRDSALRAHPDYEEARKDIGKKPQPGDLLSTDEEIRRLTQAVAVRRAHTEGVMRLKEAADKRAGALEDALRELHEAIEQYGVGSLRELAPLFRAMTNARALLEQPHA